MRIHLLIISHLALKKQFSKTSYVKIHDTNQILPLQMPQDNNDKYVKNLYRFKKYY